MPVNIDPDDPEGTDFTPEAIVRRLGRVTAILGRATKKLNIINDGTPTPPPAASVQAMQTAVEGARAEAAAALAVCDTIAQKLTPQ